MNVRHSHTFLGGLVAGLVLDKETLVVLLLGIMIGAGGALVAGQVAALVRWGRRRLEGGRF